MTHNLPENKLLKTPLNKNNKSGKKKTIQRGYNVFFTQTCQINKIDKSKKIGYPNKRNTSLVFEANNVMVARFKLFSTAIFADVAMATYAACTTP